MKTATLAIAEVIKRGGRSVDTRSKEQKPEGRLVR